MATTNDQTETEFYRSPAGNAVLIGFSPNEVPEGWEAAGQTVCTHLPGGSVSLEGRSGAGR